MNKHGYQLVKKLKQSSLTVFYKLILPFSSYTRRYRLQKIYLRIS